MIALLCFALLCFALISLGFSESLRDVAFVGGGMSGAVGLKVLTCIACTAHVNIALPFTF